ncbi:MAG TPA: alpha-E domain-containing protein [Dyella sp.]|uniref:alpha-E domain-containing protein n=1 Tax=Dyella sp. TaxID=1869338 RepID=UPI002B60614D|nr:alpha-E domain-containing protein [Dyella sp.]HUB88687.1 alpha-E domain-containing protein [Dyella sp.]
MLSRVADNLYWFSRYVRRAENMARLLDVNGQIQLDLPRGAHIAWRPLVNTLGAGAEFERLHGADTPTEVDVVHFLLVEPDNPVSLRNVVNHARETLRTVRETLPQDCWVAINDLHLYIESNPERAGSRRHRPEFLGRIIDGCMHVSALLTSNVSRDTGYQFLRLGTAIEQADMTSRIIDTAAAGLIQARSDDDAEAFQAMQWMGVLRSLAAYQMYRRQLRQKVSVELALEFLLKNREFPRSVLFCLSRIQGILPQMPPRKQVEQVFRGAMGLVFDANPSRLAAVGPCAFVDRLQQELSALHGAVHESYFQA